MRESFLGGIADGSGRLPIMGFYIRVPSGDSLRRYASACSLGLGLDHP
jgi:hypothetical protein